VGNRHHQGTFFLPLPKPMPPGHKHGGIPTVIGVMLARELTAASALVLTHAYLLR
jgi:hypothetical protein